MTAVGNRSAAAGGWAGLEGAQGSAEGQFCMLTGRVVTEIYAVVRCDKDIPRKGHVIKLVK